MPRKKNKANDNILNGVGFVIDTEGGTIPFIRDTDRLFKQYENLRLRLYKDFKIYFNTPHEQEELKAYIDETFIKLVKEYTIHGNIDFQGYIKMKLTARVKHSFCDKVLKDKSREFTTRNEGFIESQINKNPYPDVGSDVGLIEELLQGVKLSDIEQDIFDSMLHEDTQRETISKLKNKYDKEDIKETYEELQDFLYKRLVDLMDS